MTGIVSVLEHVSIASLACYKHAMNDSNCILINFKVLLKPNFYLSGNRRLWALRFDESFHFVSLWVFSLCITYRCEAQTNTEGQDSQRQTYTSYLVACEFCVQTAVYWLVCNKEEINICCAFTETKLGALCICLYLICTETQWSRYLLSQFLIEKTKLQGGYMT